ncbi:MAG: hypothetical protein R3D60_08670 [Paracoccaceae bacterium]
MEYSTVDYLDIERQARAAQGKAIADGMRALMRMIAARLHRSAAPQNA